MHSDLPELVDHALAAGVAVEVFSNLVHVPTSLWETFGRPGVRLACSYYSDAPAQHATVTGRAGSHARTRANIVEALRRSISLRVGVIDLGDGQRVDTAIAELEALGVANVGFDRLRQVGRGVREQQPSMEQLCGHCASDVLAVAPEGTVWPCVFSRWLPVGNVLASSLADILAGAPLATARSARTGARPRLETTRRGNARAAIGRRRRRRSVRGRPLRGSRPQWRRCRTTRRGGKTRSAACVEPRSIANVARGRTRSRGWQSGSSCFRLPG
jgi:Iron-sulfur cluster-binding domain